MTEIKLEQKDTEVFESRSKRKKSRPTKKWVFETKELFEKLVDATISSLIKMLGTLIALTFILTVALVILNHLGIDFNHSIEISKTVINNIK